MLKIWLTDNCKTLYCVGFTIYILFSFSVWILMFHILKEIVYSRAILLSKNLLSCKRRHLEEARYLLNEFLGICID